MRFINQLPLVRTHEATLIAKFKISRKWNLYWNQTIGNGICTRKLLRRRMRVLFAIKLNAVYVILATLKVLKLLLLALPCSIFIASPLACVTAIRTLGKLFNQSFHNFLSREIFQFSLGLEGIIQEITFTHCCIKKNYNLHH